MVGSEAGASYSGQFTVCRGSVKCAVNIVKCVVFSVKCLVYTVQCVI